MQAKIERLRRFRGEFDLGKDFVYGVFDQAETKVLGGTGLHTRAGEGARGIGYWIHADRLRQGYATELTTALTRVAFEVDAVQRVEIKCDPRNQWSAAVPRKIGFRLEETRAGDGIGVDGKPRDTMILAMTADEYSISQLETRPSEHLML